MTTIKFDKEHLENLGAYLAHRTANPESNDRIIIENCTIKADTSDGGLHAICQDLIIKFGHKANYLGVNHLKLIDKNRLLEYTMNYKIKEEFLESKLAPFDNNNETSVGITFSVMKNGTEHTQKEILVIGKLSNLRLEIEDLTLTKDNVKKILAPLTEY